MKDMIGMIGPGRQADFVLLSPESKGLRLLNTWVAGERVQ
jgi:adenine deaminase